MGSRQWAASGTDNVRAQDVDHSSQLGAVSQVSVMEGGLVLQVTMGLDLVVEVWLNSFLSFDILCEVVVFAILRLLCQQGKSIVHFALEAGWTISTVQRVGSLQLCSSCHL